MVIRILRQCETSRGLLDRGEIVSLPPKEARQLISLQHAKTEAGLVETASFVQPLPHVRRQRRYREMSDADRLAADS